MFILTNLNQLEKAATKARNIKPIVRMIEFGVYAVKGSKGDSYTVECRRNDRNEKVVACNCKRRDTRRLLSRRKRHRITFDIGETSNDGLKSKGFSRAANSGKPFTFPFFKKRKLTK